MKKYYITRYYLSLAVFIQLSYKIRKYCQTSFGYSWHKHTDTQREQNKNPPSCKPDLFCDQLRIGVMQSVVTLCFQ